MSDRFEIKLTVHWLGKTLHVIDCNTGAPIPFKRDGLTVFVDRAFAEVAAIQEIVIPRSQRAIYEARGDGTE